MWWALVMSVALNLAVIGVVAGSALSWRYAAAMGGPGGLTNLIAFAHQLPAERRAEIRQVMSEQRGTIGPLRKEARAARRDAARALLADPFDKAAFKSAQQRAVDADTRLRQAGADLMGEVVGRLSLAERRQLLNTRFARGGRGAGATPPEDDPLADPPKKP
jgi:uncharacterized membrane protein